MLLTSIKKKWLKYRVHKYTLKYEYLLSESEYHFYAAKDYQQSMNSRIQQDLSVEKLIMADNKYDHCCECYRKHTTLADYYKSLAEQCLDKKMDLIDKLNSLSSKV